MLALRLVNGGVSGFAHTIGYGQVAGIDVQHRWSPQGGGLHQVSFSLACPQRYQHPLLVAGTFVQVLAPGGVSLGWATMNEPDRENWAFTCDGFYRRGERFNAESGGGFPATSLTVAVAAGNLRGLGWGDGSSLPTVDMPGDGNVRTVSAMLTEYAENAGMVWGLDADNVPFVANDPTDATLMLRPGTAPLPTADDDYATRVVVNYEAAETGARGTVVADSSYAPFGPRETTYDASSYGPIDFERAELIAQGQLATHGPRLAYTASIAPAFGELTTAGGVPEDEWVPKHGRLLTQHGLPDQTVGGVDVQESWVVGETSFKPDDSTPLTLTPATHVARSLGEITKFAARLRRDR